MTREEMLKRYQEAGAEFLDAARAKAEGFLRDATSAGEATQERASSAVDDLVGSGRRGTEQLLEAIRREITAQLKALGVAKIVDLEALERRLSGFGSKPAPAPAAETKAPAADTVDQSEEALTVTAPLAAATPPPAPAAPVATVAADPAPPAPPPVKKASASAPTKAVPAKAVPAKAVTAPAKAGPAKVGPSKTAAKKAAAKRVSADTVGVAAKKAVPAETGAAKKATASKKVTAPKKAVASKTAGKKASPLAKTPSARIAVPVKRTTVQKPRS